MAVRRALVVACWFSAAVLLAPFLRAECTTSLRGTVREARDALNAAEKELEARRESLAASRAAQETAAGELKRTLEDGKAASAAQLEAVKETSKGLGTARTEYETALAQREVAERDLDCHLLNESWQRALGVTVSGAAGAGGASRYGVGARYAFKGTVSDFHEFSVAYVRAHAFRTAEVTEDRIDASDTLGTLVYQWAFGTERTYFTLGPGLAYLFDLGGKEQSAVSDSHKNEPGRLLLLGQLGFEYRHRQPHRCDACLVASGKIFLEPWFPVDGETPVSVLLGVQLALEFGY